MRVLSVLAALLLLAPAARAAEVIVTVGSDLAPYRETVEGLREVVPGAELVDVRRGAPKIPADAKVVVVVGTRAALEHYPDGVAVIYCISPGLKFGPRGPGGRWARVDMSPPPAELLSRLQGVAPKVKRLGVIWGSSWFEGYVHELTKAGASAGVEIVSSRVASSDEVPGALRGLQGRVDALWTPMDPRALGGVTLSAIKAFCESAGIPYFAPASSLTGYAAASIGGTFREVGRAAGHAAKAALAGEPLKTDYYPQTVSVAVNKAQAEAMGLRTR